jgi:NADH:ubiquinone oxidoreductase subunit 3 (subunit A)
MNASMFLAPLLVVWADKVPAPNDVKAGWVAFAVFIALALAVAFLGFSLSKHLRRARENAERGVFDSSDKPANKPENKPSPSAP